MKYLAKAAEAIKARFDFGDLMMLAGLGLIVYGCGLIHPAGLPISAGGALVFLAVTT